MTGRERISAVLHHQPADRLGATLDVGAIRGLSPPLIQLLYEKTGWDDEAELFNFDIRIVEGQRFPNNIDPAQYYPDLPKDAAIDEWGIASIPWPEHYFRKNLPPLRHLESLGEVKAFPIPGYQAAHQKERVALLKSQGYMVSMYSGSLFEWSHWLRGHEIFLMDCVSYPPMAEALLDKVMAFTLKMAAENALAGADIICFYDDTGCQDRLQIPPQTWRKLVKPRWKEIFQRVRSLSPEVAVFLHSDGNVEEILPDFIEIGLDVFNPLQPEAMEVEKIAREYGRDLCFWGTLSNQRTFPFGTPEAVKEEVRHRKRTLSPYRGTILAPSNILGPEIPWENIVAFLEEADIACQR